MTKGLSQRDYEALAREEWYKYAVRPATRILGIFVVSVILQAILEIDNKIFSIIFTGIGGVSYLIWYYKEGIKNESL